MVQASATLSAAIAKLSKTDRYVLALRFHHGLTQQQIAGRIGVSQMQVSRILRRLRIQLHEKISV